MRRSFLFLLVSMMSVAAVSAACKQKQTAAQTGEEDAGTETPGDDDTTGGDDDDDEEPTKPAQPSVGLPCDVLTVIENRCITCHGETAPKGSPLLNYENFAAKSKRDPNKTVGQLAAELMTAKTMPQAPGVATDGEIKTVGDWVAAGMKKSDEACILEPAGDGGGTTPKDGGTTAVDAGPPPDAGACTSGVRWTEGNKKSPLMNPGGACIGCHQTTAGGPALSFAGTVYPSLVEVDGCNGSKGPVSVVIRGRGNRSVTMQTNSAGNFFIDTATVEDLGIRAPFRVEVRAPGKQPRRMQQTITGGDCNSCHTAAGANGAPGRVLEPTP